MTPIHPSLLPNDWNVSEVVQASLAASNMSDNYQSESECSVALTESTIYLNPSSLISNTRGRVGSRRMHRMHNDSLKDHPFALLHPKDIPPPGFSISMPSFHFTQRYNDPIYHNAPIERIKKNPIPRLDKYSRKLLRRVPGAKHLVQNFEKEVVKFVKLYTPLPSPMIENDLEIILEEDINFDDGWDKLKDSSLFSIQQDFIEDFDAVLVSSFHIEPHSTLKNQRVLICPLSDPFERLILHNICKYYNLNSSSTDDSNGNRIIEVYQPMSSSASAKIVFDKWYLPEITLFDYLYSSDK